MKVKTTLISSLVGLAALGSVNAANADELTVAYFLEWPMPFEYAKVTGMYEEELGMKINWRAFDTGTAMSAAMASGDVHISVSQGVPPFVVATSAGQDLQAVDIAVSYADNDNCVIAAKHEIDKDSAGELEGLKAGVPIGTAAHYGFLKQMEHFGVDTSTMEVVDMAPAEGAAAFAQGSLDMVCGWGGALKRMKEHGNVLLSGAEKTALGINVFDVTSVPSGWAAENEETLAKFLAVTATANAMWNSGINTDEMLPVIAKDAGMSEEDALASLDTFVFPDIDAQLSEAWLGGGTQSFLKQVADFFVETGNIPSARDSYDNAVNAAPMKAAADL